MEFYEVFERVVDLLRRQGRVSYRALKRQFALDDDYLEDLKAELIMAKRLAIDEQGTVLVWIGEAPPAATLQSAMPPEAPDAAALPAAAAERRQLTVMFWEQGSAVFAAAGTIFRGWALAEALAVTNDKGERRWEAELYRLKGELLLQSGIQAPGSGVSTPHFTLRMPQRRRPVFVRPSPLRAASRPNPWNCAPP